MMKKLLVTGFEPFLDHKMNPTESIVKELDSMTIGSYEIIGRVLPVEYEEASPKLLDFVGEFQPDAVISLGLAAGRNKITPERVAINVNDGVKDNLGSVPVDEPIIVEGPVAYFSTLPIRKMVNALLENGIPAEISNTAGTYLCNNVMYSVLYELEKNGRDLLAGFIHVPASFELGMGEGNFPSWPLDTIQKAVRIIIESLDG
jgi:pyroglutamyl-peptidase